MVDCKNCKFNEENSSFALSLIKDLEQSSRRWFALVIALMVLYVGTTLYFLCVMNTMLSCETEYVETITIEEE